MKLRLQYADILPAATKPAPDDLHDKGAFGKAMEAMMAAPAPAPPRAETPTALPPKQPQLQPYTGTAKFGQGIDRSSGGTQAPKEVPAGGLSALLPQLGEQRAQTKEQTSQTSETTASIPVARPAPQSVRPGQTDQPSHLQSPAVREPGGRSNDVAGIKGPSPREGREAETTPLNAQGAGVPPGVLQPIDGVLPLSGLQPDRPAPPANDSTSASPESSSKPVSGQTRIQVPQAVGFGDLRGTPPIASADETTAPPLKIVAPQAEHSSPSILSEIHPEDATKPQPSLQSIERVHASAVVPSTPELHPQAQHAADGVEADTKQADMHALKDTASKVGTTDAPEVKASAAGNPAPTPVVAQHLVLPNVTPAVTNGGEKPVAHHLETSAAQVLQKLDFAGPDGPVQLRVDARRLDVGVSSGALGWVEVRATTGASGRVDAALHVQNEASAQLLGDQSREISDYARDHSVQLGEVSVGVGTGDHAQEQSQPAPTRDASESRVRKFKRPLAHAEQTHPVGEAMSLISVRA